MTYSNHIPAGDSTLTDALCAITCYHDETGAPLKDTFTLRRTGRTTGVHSALPFAANAGFFADFAVLLIYAGSISIPVLGLGLAVAPAM